MPKDVYDIVVIVAQHRKMTIGKVVIENLCNSLQSDVDEMAGDFAAVLDEEERA